MLIVKMILALLVFLVLLFFSNINIENARLFYTQESFVEIPLFLLLLISLLIGMVIALMISFYEKLKLRGQMRTLRREKKKMEGELNSLRKMPIVESPKTAFPEETKAESAEGSA